LSIKNSDDVREYLDKTNENLQDANYIKNPFFGGIKYFIDGENLLTVIDINPIFYNFSLFGWLMLGGFYYAFGLSYWLIPCIVIGILGIFWTSYFFSFISVKGLRKSGYTGTIIKLNSDELLKKIVFGGK